MILVTGGAGYIGSHACVELLQAGYAVTVFDNFCNSHPEALGRVERITGKPVPLIRGDCRDRAALVAALCRASGIPARIGFQDIIDYNGHASIRLPGDRNIYKAAGSSRTLCR